MALVNDLKARSGDSCEMCGSAERAHVWAVPPSEKGDPFGSILICGACRHGAQGQEPLKGPGWRTLGDAVWSGVPAVQALAWRMLHRVEASWGRDLLDVAYLEPDTMSFAKAGMPAEDDGPAHLDANGVRLASGDTVTLTKDLTVKGTSLTAKRGTAVRGISLAPNNAGQIEGRVNGQQIVILTQFVKKSG